jgi:hypothetical protein
MNYRNAQDIFPENLLKQIQRYVSGETIYIPAKNDKKAWGESSGYRPYLAKRNQSMKKDFAEGLTIEQLSEKYCLSFDSVKHIVYTKQERTMLQFTKTGGRFTWQPWRIQLKKIPTCRRLLPTMLKVILK